MKKIVRFSMLVFLIIVFCGGVHAGDEVETVGPAKGALVIAGGALRDRGVYLRMLELAGGEYAKLVIFPTALPDDYLKNADNLEERMIRDFKGYGFKSVTVLHTRSREEADGESFVKPILEASCAWFVGGRQWRLADSYLNTRTHRELNNLLDRGGVIGGSSAGATIQGSYLARGDTKANTIMMGDHEEGLAFIKNTAIDQHVLARNRQFDLFEILQKHPELLGIGLDENTAIVVQGNQFEVIGKSYVAVYDGSIWSAERNSLKTLPPGTLKFYFLKEGMRYNLEKRKVIQPITVPLRPVLQEKGIDAVIETFRELEKQPDLYFMNETVTNEYGYMLLESKKYREALKIFKMNVERYPDSSHVYHNLGVAYMKSGKEKQAALNFIKALELNPKSTGSLKRLKELYSEKRSSGK